MRLILAVWMLLTAALQAKPYSGCVKIAEETLIQARDKGIDYPAKIDLAIDGSVDDLRDFIRLIGQLDTSGAYFHYFQVYEVATLVGDKKMRAAIANFTKSELNTLSEGLGEAQGWAKPKRRFTESFPQTTALMRRVGIRPPQ